MTIENERVVQNRVIASNVNTPTSNVNTPTCRGIRRGRIFFEVMND
jgi:hypothetical protein